jgi:hypothetical protein
MLSASFPLDLVAFGPLLIFVRHSMIWTGHYRPRLMLPVPVWLANRVCFAWTLSWCCGGSERIGFGGTFCGMRLCSSARWSAALARSRVCGWSRCCWLRRCPSLHSRLVREERLGLESRVLSKKRDASIIVWEKTGTPYINKACPPGLFWARWLNPSYS